MLQRCNVATLRGTRITDTFHVATWRDTHVTRLNEFPHGKIPRGNIPHGKIPRWKIPRWNIPRGTHSATWFHKLLQRFVQYELVCTSHWYGSSPLLASHRYFIYNYVSHSDLKCIGLLTTIRNKASNFQAVICATRGSPTSPNGLSWGQIVK